MTRFLRRRNRLLFVSPNKTTAEVRWAVRNFTSVMELRIDPELVREARRLAAAIVDPIAGFIAGHTTVAVERAVTRLLGVDGVDGDGIPLPNRMVDALADPAGGAARALGAAVAESGRTPQAIAEGLVAGERLPDPAATPDAGCATCTSDAAAHDGPGATAAERLARK